MRRSLANRALPRPSGRDSQIFRARKLAGVPTAETNMDFMQNDFTYGCGLQIRYAKEPISKFRQLMHSQTGLTRFTLVVVYEVTRQPMILIIINRVKISTVSNQKFRYQAGFWLL